MVQGGYIENFTHLSCKLNVEYFNISDTLEIRKTFKTIDRANWFKV